MHDLHDIPRHSTPTHRPKTHPTHDRCLCCASDNELDQVFDGLPHRAIHAQTDPSACPHPKVDHDPT